VKEAAGGLAGANVNVLNGADGLGEIAAGLVSQGLTILDSVRQNLGNQDATENRRPEDDGNGKGLLQLHSGRPNKDRKSDDGPVDVE
jgi:flotillin